MLYVKKEYNLGDPQQELVVSMALVGAALGALFAGILADRFGRRVAVRLLFARDAIPFSQGFLDLHSMRPFYCRFHSSWCSHGVPVPARWSGYRGLGDRGSIQHGARLCCRSCADRIARRPCYRQRVIHHGRSGRLLFGRCGIRPRTTWLEMCVHVLTLLKS
jgi:hypothetical protein